MASDEKYPALFTLQVMIGILPYTIASDDRYPALFTLRVMRSILRYLH